MDEILKTVILNAPNVAVAIAALWWASKLIERMVAAQEKLVDQLLEMCQRNANLSEQVAESRAAQQVNGTNGKPK